MPHLSPIIWTGLYFVIWFVFFFVLISFEFVCKTVDR